MTPNNEYKIIKDEQGYVVTITLHDSATTVEYADYIEEVFDILKKYENS